ncbi:MAG: hypothetical protein ACLFVB_09450 [Thermoplasmata archaeon]
MKAKNLALIAILLAVLDVGVPYLVLKDIGEFWGNYLYWTLLAVTVIVLGANYIKHWGESG